MNRRTICCAMVSALAIAAGTMTARAVTMPATGLKVWLKADALTGLTNGEPVGVWSDSSGNGNNATNGGALRPSWQTNVVNGQPVVRFDGIDDYLQNAAYVHGSNDASMFIIARRNGNYGNNYHNLCVVGPSAYLTATPTNFFQLYADAVIKANFDGTALDINTGLNFTNTVFQMLTLTKANAGSGASQVFINGTSYGWKNGTLVLAGKFYIGSWYNNDLNGDIAEIAIYNSALSTTDRQIAEGLMAWKYGLQGSLPSDHPWKSINPGAPEPLIANSIPSFITSTGATLIGNLIFTGASPATVSAVWGSQDGGAPTSGLWEHTNTFAPGQWTDGSYPSTNVALPAPDITYYYRYYATNDAGVSFPADSRSFFASDKSDWIQGAAGTHYWTNSANWSQMVYPNWAGASVTITNDRASTQTISVAQTITLGELVVGNTNTITLAKLTGGAFRFDKGAMNPRIVSTNAALNIYPDVTYGSGTALEITNATSASLFGTLGGFRDLVKQGAGILVLYGNNTYTGNFIVAGSGEIQTGNGTPAAGAVIPNTAWLELTNNAIVKIGKSDQFFQGVRGIGISYVNNDGSIVIGTNRPVTGNYTTRVVEGGKVSPGFGATVGDLYLNAWSGAAYKTQIQGGDIYIDVTGSDSNDRVMFKYGANEIDRGNLHLNFLPGYTPTNGSSWTVMLAASGGTISDTNGAPLFDSIGANIDGFKFTAEIVSGTTVKVTAVAKRGTLLIVR